MGLAERFKHQLKSRDIFEKANVEDLMEGITFISTPVKNNIEDGIEIPSETSNQESLINNESSSTEIVCQYSQSAKFEELETEIINKIRRTPYWEDFSRKRQECMISKYFEAKIRTKKYSENSFLQEDKNEFIQNILTLSNSR